MKLSKRMISLLKYFALSRLLWLALCICIAFAVLHSFYIERDIPKFPEYYNTSIVLDTCTHIETKCKAN